MRNPAPSLNSITKMACKAPQSLCRKCTPLFHHLSSTSLSPQDLLPLPNYFTISLTRIFPSSLRSAIPHPLSATLESFFADTFPSAQATIYEAQFNLLPGNSHFQVRILIDIPPVWASSVERELEPRFHRDADIPGHTRWLIREILDRLDTQGSGGWDVRIPEEGQCVSSLRLIFFRQLVPHLEEMVVLKGGRWVF